MSIELYTVIAASGVVILSLVALLIAEKHGHAKLVNVLLQKAGEQESKWIDERQKLMDRIQAPSFDHLKHHEVKVIKAQKEEPKETVTLEVV